jgi:hypothetical protein
MHASGVRRLIAMCTPAYLSGIAHRLESAHASVYDDTTTATRTWLVLVKRASLGGIDGLCVLSM